MKTKLLAFALLGLFTFASCSDSDDDKQNDSWVNSQVKEQFEKDIKSQEKKVVSPVEWEKKEGYLVAEFRQEIAGSKYEVEMWYQATGTWYMTQTEIPTTKGQSKIDDMLVPVAVKEAFKKTIYNTWHVDDIDVIERAGKKTLYGIEVEKEGQTDVKIGFNVDGIQLLF